MHRHLPPFVQIAAIALVIAASGATQASARRVALVVGNNSGEATTESLHHAESDAEKFYDVLTEIGGFAPEDVVLLTGEGGDALRQAFDTLEQRIVEYREDPNNHVVLVFYYSGHAEPSFLELGSARFPLSELRARLRTSKANMRLGIVDACHSGALLRDKGGRRADAFPLSVEDAVSSSGYAILTSSSASEASQESDELRGSFFTHFLVSGLRGDADYSGDRRVTLGELYQYAYHATVRRSEATAAGPQHPHFESAQSGDLVLSHLESAAALLTFPGPTVGDFLVFDPDAGTVIAEVRKGAGAARTLAVRTGDIEIYDRSADRLRRATIEVFENEEIIIDPEAMEEISVASYALRGPSFAIALAADLGAQIFYDEVFTKGYVKDSLLYGLDLRLQNLGVAGLDLGVEALFTVSDQTIELAAGTTSQSLFETSVATTLWYRFQVHDFHIALGPRVAWLLFRRYVERPVSTAPPGSAGQAVDVGGDSTQYYSTFTPGAALELGYRILPELTLAAKTHGSYLHFEADGEARDLFTMNYLLHLQYNF